MNLTINLTLITLMLSILAFILTRKEWAYEMWYFKKDVIWIIMFAMTALSAALLATIRVLDIFGCKLLLSVGQFTTIEVTTALFWSLIFLSVVYIIVRASRNECFYSEAVNAVNICNLKYHPEELFKYKGFEHLSVEEQNRILSRLLSEGIVGRMPSP